MKIKQKRNYTWIKVFYIYLKLCIIQVGTSLLFFKKTRVSLPT